jgi:hypothetical protein
MLIVFDGEIYIGLKLYRHMENGLVGDGGLAAAMGATS